MKENIRKIAWNFLNLNVLNLFGLLIPLLAMPKLSGALGQNGYAVVLLASVVFQFGVLVVDYSFNIGAAREVAKLPSGEGQLNYYASVQSVRYLLLASYSLLVAAYLFYFDVGLSLTQYFIYIAPGLLGHIWFASWFHLGRSDLSGISILMLVARLMYLGVVILWVDNPHDIEIALAANSVPLVICGLASFRQRYLKYRIRPGRPRLDIGELRRGFSLFIADFSPNLYNNLPSFYLAHALGRADFAAYAVAIRLINAATSVQLMLGKAMLPVITVRKEITLSHVLVTNLLLACALCVALLLVSEPLVNLLVGPGYEQSVSFIDLLAPSLIFVAIASVLSNAFYVREGLDGELRNATLLLSVLAACIGIPLISSYQVWGGVVLLFIARMVLASGLLVHYLKLRQSRTIMK